MYPELKYSITFNVWFFSMFNDIDVRCHCWYLWNCLPLLFTFPYQSHASLLIRVTQGIYNANNNIREWFHKEHDKNHGFVRVMALNTTFNNILALSWRSVLLMEETEATGENHRPATSHWQTLLHKVASSTPRHERDSNSQVYWW